MIFHDFPYLDTRDLNLDWLLKNMKQIITEWAAYQAEMNQKFSDLNDAFNTLKDWIDSYFDNLDVQEEINNKIDSLIATGELNDILDPVVVSTTEAWLSEHITQPTTPAIDNSLLVSGAAADSKVAGDGIRLNAANYLGFRQYSFPLETGTWASDGITKSGASLSRIRTQAKVPVDDVFSIIIPEGWQAYPYYLHDTTLLNTPAWTTGTINKSSMPTTTNYVNFNFRKDGAGSSDISGYISTLYNAIDVIYVNDNKLNVIDINALQGYGTTNYGIDDFISSFTNANGAPKQRVISVAPRDGYNMTDYNFPVNEAGILITVSKSGASAAVTGTFQLFFTSSQKYYFRYSYSGYGPWINMAYRAETQPLIDISLFKHIAVIGDSFASGSVSVNTQQTNFDLSWIQTMGRLFGVNATNYSKGGLTTRTWMTSSYGLSKLRADTGKNLYFIAMGINDSNPDSRNVPLGVIADFTTEINTPDTFYGNMGIIYREILAKNSAAIICFVTIPRFGDRYDPYSTAIRNMAAATNTILIDSNDIPLFHTSFWSNNLSATAHPSAPLYNAMAHAYAGKFSEVAINYMSLLNDYGGFINNDPDDPSDPEDPDV